MSVRRNAPYRDRLEDDGSTLVYEGHDVPKSASVRDPKSVDQPERIPNGTLTQNGKFFEAALAFRRGTTRSPVVKVYEKIQEGIWSYNGLFNLVDAWRESSGGRMVFKFKLVALAGDEPATVSVPPKGGHRRIIPTPVKLEVWKRDGGKCVVCGAADELHFDHDLPYSKGGTSLTAANVQLLCARHNLLKGDKII
jgi:hypothetical protein